MGVSVAIPNVSKMLTKATVAPSRSTSAATCRRCCTACSLVSEEALEPSLDWHKDYADKKRQKHRWRKPHAHAKLISCEYVQSFSRMSWVIGLLHVNFINMFQNVSPSNLFQRYDYSIGKAGVVSSVSHLFEVFAPSIGLAVDRFDGRTLLHILAAIKLVHECARPGAVFVEFADQLDMQI
ncbi:Major Facilitator Superfamily (MFS) [Phytophthora cinnamomi]|uniref:Major Facilitator Superfamily (MFS) n=1 Tax=Phytophthora cinnamomi TaxID=4785 RepID=UPI00355A3670|nr:Major Facilitator Superfamily (MFS) [Phytophthora cinnamomi]